MQALHYRGALDILWVNHSTIVIDVKGDKKCKIVANHMLLVVQCRVMQNSLALKLYQRSRNFIHSAVF